jgi:hypothetical protein
MSGEAMLTVKKFIVGFTFLVFIPFLLSDAVKAQDKGSSEDQIWKMEELYWNYVKDNNIENYLTLWHEDWVGWPGFSTKPIDKSNISDWIPPLFEDKSKTFDYELKKMAVVSFSDDIVAAHYGVSLFFTDKETGKKTLPKWSKITHTWKRYGDKWLIITGMSADLDKSPD